MVSGLGIPENPRRHSTIAFAIIDHFFKDRICAIPIGVAGPQQPDILRLFSYPVPEVACDVPVFRITVEVGLTNHAA